MCVHGSQAGPPAADQGGQSSVAATLSPDQYRAIEQCFRTFDRDRSSECVSVCACVCVCASVCTCVLGDPLW